MVSWVRGFTTDGKALLLHLPVRMFWNACSTLEASRAEVSMKERLFSAVIVQDSFEIGRKDQEDVSNCSCPKELWRETWKCPNSAMRIDRSAKQSDRPQCKLAPAILWRQLNIGSCAGLCGYASKSRSLVVQQTYQQRLSPRPWGQLGGVANRSCFRRA